MSKPTKYSISSRRNPKKSAETIGHNKDILSTVLLKVSTKPLIRFKAVSHLWRSLISSPYFVSRYNLLHPPSLSGLFLVPRHPNEGTSNRIEYISLGQNQPKSPVFPFFNLSNIKLLQSCNGLLLYCQEERHYYVLNPTTKESKLLPSCPESIITPTSPSYYSLAFDPAISPHYKIICVTETSRQNEYSISIYSSESQVWRPSQVQDFLAPRDIDFTRGTYCNGSIHWTKRTMRGLYFNVEDETLKHMPESPRQEQYSCEYFGHSRGYLHCVFTMEGLPYYELFEMEKDYSAWNFKCRIELDMEVHNQHPHFMHQCDVLSVFRGPDEEVGEIIMSVPGEIIAYDCKTKTTRKIGKSRLRAYDMMIWYGIYHVYEHFESLCPVNI